MLLTVATPGYCDTAVDYLNRGNAKHEKGDLDGAIADFTKAIELDPGYAWAYGRRGNAKQAKGDFDGAIGDYTKAIELKPDYADAYGCRGQTKEFKGDLDGAIADCTKAIELRPNYAEAYGARGNAKADKGDLDGAIADYTKTIALKPDSEGAYTGRGMAKQAKGDAAGALGDYNKALELNPKDVGALDNRGSLRYDAHDFTNALADFRKVLELYSSIDFPRFRVWLIRARLGETEAATSELQTYLAGRTTGKPDDWASKVGHFLTGQLSELEFLAAAKDADQKTEASKLCQAYFYAGSKRLFAGDKATAMDYLQRSIATDRKDFIEYASAVAELKALKGQR